MDRDILEPDPISIDELKAQWLDDPCWDIEETEGFEDHRDELLAFKQMWEARWASEREAHLLEKASAMGIPGNTALAAYIELLESRIAKLEERS